MQCLKSFFCGHPVELKLSVCIYFCLTHRRDWSRADASEKCRIRINIWYQIWQFFTLLSINYNNSESSGEWSRWSLQDWGHWLGKYLALKGLSWSEKSFNYYCGGLCGAAINRKYSSAKVSQNIWRLHTARWSSILSWERVVWRN